jgi:arylsulfatase A-like enzyme
MKSTSSLLIALAALTAAALAAPGWAAEPVPGKPNVIFIISDDLNDWIGPYGGHPQAKTPHLDRLAQSGAFTMLNAQCAATVCGPTRSALLTGLRPSTTGVYGNVQNLRDAPAAAAVPTMPQYFSRHGYVSLSTGKIFHKHHTPAGTDHGQWAFDRWDEEKGGFPIDRSKLPLSRMPSSGFNNVELDWGPTTSSKEDTQDWRTAQWAVAKLQQGFDRPFFMMLGLSKPHLPWYVPQEYFDRYDLATLQIANFRLDDLDDILTPQGRKKFEPSKDFLTIQKHDKFKEATQAYLACISYVDDCLGVVLDGLARSRYRDNTIIVFIGDHGWFLGEKLRFRKTHLWEESCRTPLLLKVPGYAQSVRVTRPVSFMDLYPTLAALCGLPAPAHTEGRNLVPLLQQPDREWDPVLTTMGFKNHSVRSDRYRYNVYQDGTEELYDHATDPMEWKNLIKEPQFAAIIREHQRWLPTVNAADAPIPKAAPAPKRGGKAKKATP